LTTETPALTLNEAQRKLLQTAFKQVSNAQSNVSEAMHLEGLRTPEARQTWVELFTAQRRIWNILHDDGSFILPPPADVR
jgi:hypothetical protein